MSFEERIKLSENMEKSIIGFLINKKFILEKTGYENHISKGTREILRKIHDDPTITFLRYIPDYFSIFKEKKFFVELKVMDSPIRLDSRVQDLKKVTGLNHLSKDNIGVVETAAIKNYENLSRLGVKILVIVYSTFHPKRLLIEWETNIVKFFNDDVKLGQGNASFTPFTNIDLDKMQDFKSFFKSEFGLIISDQEVGELIDNIK